jgi:hypothetical protein
MKEINELATKITFSLDEINVLGSQGNVAMASMQFYQVDLLRHEKQEKEVFHRKNKFNISATFERIAIQQGLSQSYKSVMSVELISPVSIMIDVSLTISLEKYHPPTRVPTDMS